MINFLFHRVKSNLILYLLLLIGAILSATVFSSIPMFANSIMQKVLSQDMSNALKESNVQPGQWIIDWEDSGNSNNDFFEIMDTSFETMVVDSINMAVIEEQTIYKTNRMRIEKRSNEFNTMTTQIASLSDIENHIYLTNGEVPSVGLNDEGAYEVMASMNAMLELNLVLDRTYAMQKNGKDIFYVKVVGAFTPDTESVYYWQENIYDDLSTVMITQEANLMDMIDSYDYILAGGYYRRTYFDYEHLDFEDVADTIDIYYGYEEWVNERTNKALMYFEILPLLENFKDIESNLTITIIVLAIPIVLISIFYTYMISRLIVKNDENEIALLKSRGSSTIQIFSMYVLQSLIIVAIGMGVGPLLGRIICQLLGSTDGFMSFGYQGPSFVKLSSQAYVYAVFSGIVYLLSVLIPSLSACGKSIVQYKQKKNVLITKSLWEKFYIDIIILLIASYGYYVYMMREGTLSTSISQGQYVDPLIFLVSALFILGANLFILRLYPYLMRGIMYMTKRYLGPIIFYSFNNVSQADSTQKFIMLFIMLAISFGIINGSQARTLNLNTEDSVYYHQGADVVIKPYTDPKTVDTLYQDMYSLYVPPDGITDILVDDVPYDAYKSLEGVKDITKVFTHDETNVEFRGAVISNVHLMAIEPNHFMDVSWFRNDLLPMHQNYYMNAMIEAPNGVFLSSDFRDIYNFKAGDVVALSWDQSVLPDDEGRIVCTIFGFIDNFVTHNPYYGVEIFRDEQEKGIEPELTPFALVNFSYIEDSITPRNYDIWLSTEKGTTNNSLLTQLGEQGLETQRVYFLNQELEKEKNNAILLGTNGILTMSFLIILFVAFIGYLIFWIMTIRNRALVFGILRSMGLSMSQVNGIIIMEQILMTGASILFGLLVGVIGSKLFVPMLQQIGTLASQYPPFTVVILNSDIAKVMIVCLAMLGIGVTILSMIVRHFKVNQVLKLGED